MRIYWRGSDVLFQKTYPPGTRFRFRFKILVERIIVKIMTPFLEGHYTNCMFLKAELEQIGFRDIEILDDNIKYSGKIERRNHPGFNVMFYWPKNKKNERFIEWLYGADIMLELQRRLPEVNWIIIDGERDMAELFPIVDFYLRPNRHDGNSHLVRECQINGIPFYWSQENPDVDEAERLVRNEIHNR